MRIKVKQHDVTDCGAACLASVAAHYKLGLSLARIRQLAGTNQKGTNLLGLIQAAESLGFVAKGVRCSEEQLPEVPLPAIAHLQLPKGYHHYVVVLGIGRSHVRLMDPAFGKITKRPLDQFLQEWSGVFLLLAPGEKFRTGNQKLSTYHRFWQLLKPHNSSLIQAGFGAMVYTLLGLSTSIYIQKITDHVLINQNSNLLNLLSVSMLVILAVSIFIGVMKSVFVLRSGQMIDARLILGYYRHLMRLPQTFFDTMRTGEIISRIGDAVKIRAFINDIAINLLVSIFIVVFSFGLMFTYYWKLALMMLSILPLYAGIYWIVNKLNKRRERELMERAADLESQLVESLGAVRTLKQMGITDYANDKTEKRFVQLLQSTYKSGLNAIFSTNSSEFVSRLFTIILLWVGSYFVMNQSITPGELLSFYAIVGYFTGPARSLIGMNKHLQNAFIAADRLFEIFDLAIEEKENAIELKADNIGDIRFESVQFAYGATRPLFKNLNLSIRKGEITAVVGESGSGKSTLAALIQGIYQCQQGKVLIGDLDINYMSEESLRTCIGIVPQQLDLFAGNIINNIALGDSQPDLERIVHICRQLGILSFIEKLPEGFNTMLGERGYNLSGGQRQRLAIARTLYRNPEVIIFDEATSALDASSEKYIQDTIQQLKADGKMIIIITHRLSSVIQADNILVMEEGQLSEEGTHQTLLAAGGPYQNLWNKQFPETVRMQLAA